MLIDVRMYFFTLISISLSHSEQYLNFKLNIRSIIILKVIFLTTITIHESKYQPIQIVR